MSFPLSEASLRHLQGVHPDLVKVANQMVNTSDTNFAIICGLRSLEEQEHLVSIGASTTMRSRHLTGHAFDWVPIINGQVSWDAKVYPHIIAQWKQAALGIGIVIESGGDWVTFKDWDHIQLPWNKYPAVFNGG